MSQWRHADKSLPRTVAWAVSPHLQGRERDMFVGIDVSKARLDVAASDGSQAQFAQDEAGHQALVAWVTTKQVQQVVLEATGGYEKLVTARLVAAGLAVAVVNARQVRAFAKALGKLAKTDAIDAVLLAEFAARVQP